MCAGRAPQVPLGANDVRRLDLDPMDAFAFSGAAAFGVALLLIILGAIIAVVMGVKGS